MKLIRRPLPKVIQANILREIMVRPSCQPISPSNHQVVHVAERRGVKGVLWPASKGIWGLHPPVLTVGG